MQGRNFNKRDGTLIRETELKIGVSILPKKAMEVLTESMYYVLMAFREKPMCGTDAADFIERRTCGRIKMGPATLYTILAKFVQEQYIREMETDGRKRIYHITEKGAVAYEAELRRLKRCVADAESVSEPVLGSASESALGSVPEPVLEFALEPAIGSASGLAQESAPKSVLKSVSESVPERECVMVPERGRA